MRFRLLMTRHRTPGVTLKTQGITNVVDGERVTLPGTTKNNFECAVIELPTRLIYESAGRYTSADREMFTREKVPLKSTIMYDGFSFTVEEYVSYISMAQLYKYRLKAVSTHG